MGRKTCEVMELRGYITPKDRQRDDEGDELDDDSEDAEEQPPEFLDMAEIDQVHSGGHLFQSPVPVSKVDLWTFSGEAREVEGHFPLTGPWWEVTCSVVERGGCFVMKGFPSYQLRSDLDRDDWIHIVSLFLTACGAEEQFVSQLFGWLPENRDVSLHNLMDVLGEFSKAGKEDEARMLTTRVSTSAAWMHVQALHLYPRVSKYLPRLLPRQFALLLGMEKNGPSLSGTQGPQQRDDGQEEGVLLDKLEQIIAEDVWKLGFNNLVYEELKLVRCEAQLKAFQDCNLFQDIPPKQRHSLMAYDELKRHCFKTGSTFMTHKDLCGFLTKREMMSDVQAWEAIHFLKELAVVVVPTGMVVLRKFDFYETGIAKCLGSLVELGRWNIPVNPVEVLEAAAEERQQKEATNQSDIVDLSADDKASVKPEPQLNQSPPSAFPEEPTINSSPIQLDPDHVRAVEKICANPVTVISGKAGCGKTTVVSQLFKAAVQGRPKASSDPGACPGSESEEDENRAIQSHDEILLTAPTGRAASLLTKKTQFTAYTLHQVLFKYMNFRKQKRAKKEDEEAGWEFKHVRVLIVDEGSMVPVYLLHSVLNILVQHADLRKFIILGDVRQLSSIEPGNVLNDLFDTLTRVGWAVDMKTNHRSESQLIVDNAGRIANMGTNRNRSLPVRLKFDAVVDLGQPHTTLTPDKKFIFIRLPAEGAADDLQKAVKFLITTAPGLNDPHTSQFIAFKRCDVSLINELCCKHYNNHTTKNHKNKLIFQPGDKICCTKNGLVTLEEAVDKKDVSLADGTQREQAKICCTKNGLVTLEEAVDKKDVSLADGTQQEPDNENERPSTRLCNGEIFFILEDVTVEEGGRRSRYLTLDDDDGRVFKVDYREVQKKCKLQHAWARTIHTYQGSENETIVYVVGDSWAEGWKHSYTAITRGQKRVYVVSKEKVIESTVKRPEVQRKTRLGGLLKEYVVQGQELVGTPRAQPNTPRAQPNTPWAQPNTPRAQPNGSTPLRTPTPGRPVSSGLPSTPFRPKRLWKTEKEETKSSDDEQLAEPLPARAATEGNDEAASAGHKRPLPAEHEEVPRKQPHRGGW